MACTHLPARSRRAAPTSQQVAVEQRRQPAVQQLPVLKGAPAQGVALGWLVGHAQHVKVVDCRVGKMWWRLPKVIADSGACPRQRHSCRTRHTRGSSDGIPAWGRRPSPPDSKVAPFCTGWVATRPRPRGVGAATTVLPGAARTPASWEYSCSTAGATAASDTLPDARERGGATPLCPRRCQPRDGGLPEAHGALLHLDALRVATGMRSSRVQTDMAAAVPCRLARASWAPSSLCKDDYNVNSKQQSKELPPTVLSKLPL